MLSRQEADFIKVVMIIIIQAEREKGRGGVAKERERRGRGGRERREEKDTTSVFSYGSQETRVGVESQCGLW